MSDPARVAPGAGRVLDLEVDRGADIDAALLAEVVGSAAARAGWTIGDGRGSGRGDAIVQVAGTASWRGSDAGTTPTLRVELCASAPAAPVPQLRWHGLDTLGIPIASWLVGLEHPADPVAYGPSPDQSIDWRWPETAPRAVAVLVHGGFYRSRWGNDLMTPLAVDLLGRGWASANLEYRRPDRHGWSATVHDVLAGVNAARAASPGVPVALIGHSAGGQLVLQAIESTPAGTADLAVSLTGVVDLVAAHDRFLGDGAVAVALGGSPSEHPERYAAASPAEYQLRSGEWLLVETDRDSLDLREMNRRLSRRPDLGHPELIEGAGDHFTVIDPASAIWLETIGRVEQRLGLA